MKHSVRRSAQVANVSLAFLLLFFSSAILSMGVFTVAVEKKAPALRSVWSSTVGLVSVFSAPIMILTGFLLDERGLWDRIESQKVHPLTTRLRFMAIPVALGYAALAVAIPGVTHSSPWLVRLAVLPIAVPWGYCYLVGIHVLLAWLPVSTALAMSVVSAAFGSSQFVLAPVLSYAIQVSGVEYVIGASAIIISSSLLIILLLLRFPTRHDGIIPQSLHPESSLEEALLLSCHDNHRNVSWKDLFRCASFYQYLLVLFLGRAAYACIPYFFKLGYVYGASRTTVVGMFQALSICAVCYSFCSNMVLDVMSYKKGRSMVRPLFVLVFLIQASMFSILILFSQSTDSVSAPTMRLLVLAALIVTLESQTAFGVILSREVFGARNYAVVYGFAGGLALGVSESAFTFLVSYFETRSASTSTTLTFVPYYVIGSVACIIGALLACSLKRCKFAYEIR